jgi:hypothetical protein
MKQKIKSKWNMDSNIKILLKKQIKKENIIKLNIKTEN